MPEDDGTFKLIGFMGLNSADALGAVNSANWQSPHTLPNGNMVLGVSFFSKAMLNDQADYRFEDSEDDASYISHGNRSDENAKSRYHFLYAIRGHNSNVSYGDAKRKKTLCVLSIGINDDISKILSLSNAQNREIEKDNFRNRVYGCVKAIESILLIYNQFLNAKTRFWQVTMSDQGNGTGDQ